MQPPGLRVGDEQGAGLQVLGLRGQRGHEVPGVRRRVVHLDVARPWSPRSRRARTPGASTSSWSVPSAARRPASSPRPHPRAARTRSHRSAARTRRRWQCCDDDACDAPPPGDARHAASASRWPREQARGSASAARSRVGFGLARRGAGSSGRGGGGPSRPPRAGGGPSSPPRGAGRRGRPLGPRGSSGGRGGPGIAGNPRGRRTRRSPQSSEVLRPQDGAGVLAPRSAASSISRRSRRRSVTSAAADEVTTPELLQGFVDAIGERRRFHPRPSLVGCWLRPVVL